MPHIIASNTYSYSHPIYKNKGKSYHSLKISDQSGNNNTTDNTDNKKIPMTYDSVKNIATSSNNDQMKLKK